MATRVWRDIVRPIAIGGMMAGAANTLFRMRKNIGAGSRRAFRELMSGAGDESGISRTNQYMSSRLVLTGIGVMFVVMLVIYTYFSRQPHGGHRGRRRHAHCGILLRHGLRLPGGRDRIVQ